MRQKIFLCLIVSALCSVISFSAVRGKRAMVVSAHQHASEAGIEILKKGGNAIDAAVAVGYALAVVFPEAGNIGGGGFMLVRTKDGKATVIDFRETAPMKSTRNMFLDDTGNVTDKSINGHLSVGVPGNGCGIFQSVGTIREEKIERCSQTCNQTCRKGFCC